MLIPLLLLAVSLPTDTTVWTVDNHGRGAGELTVVTTPDSIIARWIYTDRNRGGRVETRYRVAPGGAILGGEQRSVLPDGLPGPISAHFAVEGDTLLSGIGNARPARSAIEPGAYVGLRGGTPLERGWLARHLISQPDLTAPHALGGTARAEIVADTTLIHGATEQRARLVMVYQNNSRNPSGVWLDERGDLLATDASWFITIKKGRESFLPALRSIELRWRNIRGDSVARNVVTPTRGTIAITNGNLFDSDAGVMIENQTVIVTGDRIVAVGPATQITPPEGATIIDATGKTVMPGMWDMHTHLQVSNQSVGSLIQLANGLTTVRDLAADIDVAVSQRDREREGRLASPRVILGGLIEGPLAWAGPSEALARDEAEARAWVRRYAELGYKQIKLYNVVHPDLVPVISEEARKHGMLLSGHIPRGMSIEAAIALGYDEIQHAAFFFSNFFQDSLYIPQMRAYSMVANIVAPNFDVDSPEMTKLLDYVKSTGTAVDGSFNIWIGGGSSSVGVATPTDVQKVDSAYMHLLRRLYAHGITLIAGTDNTMGVTFRRELEMYELAGIPPARILQIATIDAAKFMGEANEYGSIRNGKVADIIVVNGNPVEKISALSEIETVIRGGRLYDVEKLYSSTGIQRRR